MSEQITEETFKEALERVCNQGPYHLERQTGPLQVWRCQACGAEIRTNITLTMPTWMHYKPGCEHMGKRNNQAMAEQEPIKWSELTPEQRNRIVAEKVMGWQETPCEGEVVEQGIYWSCSSCGLSGTWDRQDFDRFAGHMALPPPYTTSMDAAWKIVDTFDEIEMSMHVKGRYRCILYKGSRSASGRAETPQEAICLAALRCCGIEVDTSEEEK